MKSTKVHNTVMSGLNTASTKRLHSYCRSRFPEELDSEGYVLKDIVFDDQARDVVFNYALNPEKLESELKYLDSMGYGCKLRPAATLEQIQHFQEAHVPSFQWNRNYQQAKAMIIRDYISGQRLKVLEYKSDSDIKDALSKTDTHAGFHYLLTGIREKGGYIDGILLQYKEELTRAKEMGTLGYPILVGNRLQISGAYEDGKRTGTHKKKTRLISMVDIFQIIAECQFSRPLQRAFKHWAFYAGGKEPSQLSDLVRTGRNNSSHWVSLDYSRYDQSLPAWLIRDAFSLLKMCFSDTPRNRKWDWLWEIVVNDFIDKSFVGPNGKLYSAHDGVPSGSMFTQIIDTLCNLLMITTYLCALKNKGVNVGFRSMIICGDDNLVFTRVPLNRDDIAGYLLRNFGVECHPKKCAFGTREQAPEFLSRVWRNDGEWREPLELFAKLCYPEKFRPYARDKNLKPELIVYSYILAYPLGMRDLIDVKRFIDDNRFKIPKWSSSYLRYQSGYWSYLQRYEKLSA